VKRKDIKAGVVYAIKASYGPPSPVVFLEDQGATLFEHRNGRAGCHPAPEGAKAGRGDGYPFASYGYAAITGQSAYDGGARAERAAEMEGIDLAAELAAFRAGERPDGEELGQYFTLLTSLSRVCPWDAAVAAYEAERAADQKRMDAADAMTRRRSEVIAAFAATGITVMSSGPGMVTLSLDEAGKLLRLVTAEEAGQ
jgi:hypothetical protein